MFIREEAVTGLVVSKCQLPPLVSPAEEEEAHIVEEVCPVCLQMALSSMGIGHGGRSVYLVVYLFVYLFVYFSFANGVFFDRL